MPSLMDSSLSSDNNSIKSNHRESMYDGKAQHRALIKKINLLRDILRKQRRRHWLAVEESRKLSKRTMKFVSENMIICNLFVNSYEGNLYVSYHSFLHLNV
jgi:hypothetical protein